MASDNFPNLGTGAQQIKQYIQQLVRREIAQYARSFPLQIDPQGNIIIPNGNSLTVTGSMIVDGSLESGNYQQGAAGYLLSGTQISTYTSIAGFGNGQVVQATATGFGLTTTSTVLASGTLTVPQGYTRLLCLPVAQLYATNPNTTGGADSHGTDALYTQARLSVSGQNDTFTPSFPVGISGSNGYATTTAAGGLGFTGLTPGQTITYSVAGHSAFASIATNSANTAVGSFALFWLP